MSSFFGINIASGALRSFQRAMDVTGHNLANVNTPGYSRQTADFESVGAFTFWDHGSYSLGQGVTIGQIQRIRDNYLEDNQNRNASDLGKSDVYSAGLAQIDSIYGEPGTTGINDALDKFFNSWSGLASDPSSAAAKSAVKGAGQVLADRVRGRYSDLDMLRKQANDQVTGTIDQINTLSTQIAKMNEQISKTEGGASNNDLLDQRDKAINQLATLVDVHTARLGDGSITISAGGYSLVANEVAHPFPKTYDATNSTVTDGTSTFSVRGGKLAGAMQLVDQVGHQQGQLDKLADTIREQVNALHQSGKAADGTTNIAFFNNGPTVKGAISFDLSDEVKASATMVMAGSTGKSGDGDLAQSLSDLRSATQASLGKQSIVDYFKSNLNALAGEASYQTSLNSTYQSISTQIQGQIAQTSGVSVDEEMVNMTKLQRSYQANAKMLTVFDDLLQQTIDMVRP